MLAEAFMLKVEADIRSLKARVEADVRNLNAPRSSISDARFVPIELLVSSTADDLPQQADGGGPGAQSGHVAANSR
jgi:hypothetical protein